MKDKKNWSLIVTEIKQSYWKKLSVLMVLKQIVTFDMKFIIILLISKYLYNKHLTLSKKQPYFNIPNWIVKYSFII